MHYYPNLWQDFLAAGTTLAATQRNYPDWHKNRDRYFVWVIDIEDLLLEQYLKEVKQRLSSYLITPYVRQAHITLFVCGFMVKKRKLYDDYDADLMSQQIAALEKLNLDSFELQLGAVNSFTSAPFVEIIDKTGSLDAIRKQLSIGIDEFRSVAYIPHITLGIYADNYDSVEISEIIGCCKPIKKTSLTINSLSLMSYSADDIGSSLCLEHCLALTE